jgi:hypothetical protein
MAISTVAKNFRDGSLVLSDATGSPISVTVQYTGGDFSVSGLRQANKDINKYLDRGDFFSARKTNQVFPTFSFTAIFTDLTDGSEKTLVDACLKTGAFAAGVSTLGANADVWALKAVFTVEGTDLGDSADHVITLNDCVISDVSISEGDPDTFSISGELLGTITMT